MEYEYMRALRQRFFVEPNVMTQREIEKGVSQSVWVRKIKKESSG